MAPAPREPRPIDLNLVRVRETGEHRVVASVAASVAADLLHDLERHPSPSSSTRLLATFLRDLLEARQLAPAPPAPPPDGPN